MKLATLLLTAAFAQATATTGPAESVDGVGRHHGDRRPGGGHLPLRVRHGEQPDRALGRVAPAGSGTVTVRETLTNLTPSTTYRYRVVSGASEGSDRTFTTAAPPRAPSISARSATGVGANGATLRAGVNPRSLATTVRFEYGRTTAYGSATPEQAIGAGGSTVNVTAAIGGLAPGPATSTAPWPRARRASPAAPTARSRRRASRPR